MTIYDLCSHFDRSEIVDTQLEIDRDHYASIDTIFTDGEYKTSIGDNGYLKISNVCNANYIMFIDLENKIYLCIYKYISVSKFKPILQRLQMLKNTINKLNGSPCNNDNVDIIDNLIDDDVIDINTFCCIECDSYSEFTFTRSKTNPDILQAKCDKCKTEYTFTPSKYYKIASKKCVYFKSEKSSRDICIKT